MKRRSPPKLDRLKKLYSYDRKTGVFTHKRTTGRGKSGDVAGCLRPDGYIDISIDGHKYLAHHLAWFYIFEEWVQEIDHKNRNRSQNWIKNLRPASRGQNNANSNGWDLRKRKHKLPRGVYHYPQCPGRYRAQIVHNRKQIHLGCFNSIIEAEKAYKAAALTYFGDFHHPRSDCPQ
jgi:hypothetical protein